MLSDPKLRGRDTEELVVRVHELKMEGRTWAEIARTLNRNANSIISLYRYNVDEDYREKSIARSQAGVVRRRAKRKHRKLDQMRDARAVTKQIGTGPAAQ